MMPVLPMMASLKKADKSAPTILVLKHGSFCDPEKVGSKIWTAKSRVQKTGSLLFKKDEAALVFSF